MVTSSEATGPCWMLCLARQAIPAKFARTTKMRWDLSFPVRATRHVRTGIFLLSPMVLGGLDLGEVASATAVSVLIEEFEKAQGGAMLISLLPRLVQHANAAVHDRTLAPEFRGKKMATTVVACALRHDQAIVSHVGDSRCYLVRKGIARQITQDHTLGERAEKDGSDFSKRDRNLGFAARADPLSRTGDVCLARHHRR